MKRKIPKKYQKGGVTSAKAKEILRHGSVNGKPLTAKQKGYFGLIAGGKKMQTGGAPPTLQSRLENSWRAELGEIDDLVASGLGDISPQAQAKMMERQGSLRGQLGLNKYGQPENKNTWTEGVKSDDWTFNTGGDRASSWEPGVQTFTYDPQKEKRKTDRAYRRANQQDTSTIYTGEGDDLNPELEGGGFNKESMTDPDSGLSKGIGIGANLAGTYLDKLAGEDYAARENKRDEAVADVDPVTGQSNLYLENKRAMAWKKGQTDLVEGYDYAGHGAKSGFAKGAGMGAQVGGPMGALGGGALGAIGGGLMGKSQGEDAKFELAADTAKKRKALRGMQADEVSLIDPTKDDYSTIAAVTVKKGGKVKKQAGGLIEGPGTGTSDDIPGNLNGGDFVATAKNKNKALALRKQFGLPMQKANLQKGGKTMKKIPVKVSNGETLFTKSEINSMVKKGGRQVIDYLNSLAPEAEVPLQNGGTVQKDNSQEMINKYGGKKEDWYYGRYIGDDPLVKKKIEASKLKNKEPVHHLGVISEQRLKEIPALNKEIKDIEIKIAKIKAVPDYSEEAIENKGTPESLISNLEKELSRAKSKRQRYISDEKEYQNSVLLNEQSKRIPSEIKTKKDELAKVKENINNESDIKKIATLGEEAKILEKDIRSLNDLLHKSKEDPYTPAGANDGKEIKSKVDKIAGTKPPTSDFELPFNILGGTAFEQKPHTAKPPSKIPPKVSDKDDKKQKVTTTGTAGTIIQDKSDIKKKQQALVDAGYDLGTTGSNDDGVDGDWGPLSQTAWEDYQAKDLEYWKTEAQKAKKDPKDTEEMGPPTMEEMFPGITEEMEDAEGDEEVTDKVTEEAEREFPWSDLAGTLQAGMGYKGLAAMGQRPEGVKSADLAAQKARIDAAESEFNIPIDETLRDIERTRIASTMPTTGERGYEQAKRSAATGQAMSNIQKTREQKAILEGQAAERFNLAKLGMQGQMASALAGEDRMLFQDDMQAFQQKQGAYAQLLQAGIANFLKGKEARATRRAMTEIEGNNNTYNFNV